MITNIFYDVFSFGYLKLYLAFLKGKVLSVEIQIVYLPFHSQSRCSLGPREIFIAAGPDNLQAHKNLHPEVGLIDIERSRYIK